MVGKPIPIYLNLAQTTDLKSAWDILVSELNLM